MFKDIVKIKVIAGRGGDGCVSFRREKYVPRGGPDGGDGGRGGNCIIVVNPNLSTLSHILEGQVFKAGDGENGSGRKKHGADGEDVVIEVPRGTQVIDEETGKLIVDMKDIDNFVIARGGRGGLGNWHFRSPTNQAPTQFTKGEKGEEKRLILDLKLIADVGLVGYPNAGKSSIIRKLTSATPKVADYPFTTLEPVLGVIPYQDKRIVVADIPGIIQNAHLGAGLGLEFLKHIERTKFIILVLDITDKPEEKTKVILKELKSYNKPLVNKIKFAVLNKIDLLSQEERNNVDIVIELVKEELPKKKFDFLLVSALTGEGIPNLKGKIINMFSENHSREIPKSNKKSTK
ncbi:MAG: GTPase ObgE [Spirochaetia bacterium]|nr:GTPase ObgE [Spirochaetota bacterium]MCX8096342.1 GTPase ObgE [Spirochaetota bacterium]MDW8112297.1 GTPase ObgE [Spirochaetia bacterium]